MGRTKQRTASMREEVLDVARGLLLEHGPAALTTRAVAVAAQTSLAAVDELFGGKPGLLRHLAMDGFVQFAEALDAPSRSGDPDRDLLQLASVLRRFARERRHQYVLMFSRPIAELDPDADEAAAADAIYRHVVSRVAAALGPERTRGAAKDAAIALVATMRGLVELEHGGVLGSGAASIERRWRTAVLAVVRGCRGG